MKIRLLHALVGLAIGFALPAFAQQKDTVDQGIMEQLAGLGKKIDEAFDNNDAAAVAALFTKDAVLVNNTGPIYGQEAIEKNFADLFQKFHISNRIGLADSRHMIGTAGNEVWGNGEWSQTLQGQNGDLIKVKGYWSAIDVREGDDWKIRMLTWNMTPAPAK
jgi:ketosteroid isomerase-like protein